MSTYIETNWETAPNLIDDHQWLELTPQKCNLNYWIEGVAQGTLLGLQNGHPRSLAIPSHMFADGPLRKAISREFSYRALTEEMATRTLSHLINVAPTKEEMEFTITLVMDEARHARVFRDHLFELDIDGASNLESLSGGLQLALKPVENFALKIMRDDRDFLGGIAINTILVEGLLAPASELSERKWRKLNPVAAAIEHGTGIDEVRHLSVGSNIIKQHLDSNRSRKNEIVDLIRQGQELWTSIELKEEMLNREELFQEGLREHREAIGEYEIVPGIKLVDTSPEQRVALAETWSRETQNQRLKYIGLQEITF